MSSKMHGACTPNGNISQNIPKSGGTKTVLTVSTDIMNQVTFNTGRNSNR